MKFVTMIFFASIILSSCLGLIFPVIPTNPDRLENAVSPRSNINAETFEQYKSARYFVGDFSVVDKREGKPYIINKSNKKILGSFSHVGLYESENGDFVFALTGKNTDHRVYQYGGGLDPRYSRVDPTAVKYRIYNVTTGKMVLELGVRDYPDEIYTPRIRFYGNYMTVESNNSYTTFNKDVYEIKSDGSLAKTEMDIDELIAKIAKERNLQYKTPVAYEKSWVYAHDWKPDFGYFFKIDMDKLKEHIPQDMEFETDRHKSPRISLIGCLTYPLQDRQLYAVSLKKDWKSYLGLYDAIENRWAINPLENVRAYYYGANIDWIIGHTWKGAYYRDDLYNIKTRKKYEEELGKEPIGEDF